MKHLKILKRDEVGNYAAMDYDGKIGVYNADGQLVNRRDTRIWLQEHGFSTVRKGRKTLADVEKYNLGTVWTGRF